MKDYPKLNRIADLLKQDGRSQKWLADKLGITTNAMNNWCTQKSQPSLERLFEVAAILGYGVCDLINTDYMQDKQ